LCQIHRCEVQSLHGHSSEAEHDALQAAQQLSLFGDYLMADIHYLVGDIRLRRGDLAGAEEAFRTSHQHGRDPQPGLALVRLARGDTEAAVSALRLALGGEPQTPVRRARLLAAHVQAELRLDEVAAAAASADELAALAERSESAWLQAMAALACGSVCLAGDDGSQALRWLRNACATYRDLACPYEVAEARVLIGQALRRLGDESTARLEFDAARHAFTGLGAISDVSRVDVLLDGVIRPHGLTAREVEVLRLVARGRSNRQIAETLVISENTVARHLSNIFTKLDVSSRAAATSFAYEHDLV
jgi:DNA-binding CsgD family transcriptional regulator